MDPSWRDWFEGLEITPEAEGTSTLAGPLKDQAALHGVLAKMRGLGLAVVALEVSEAPPPEESMVAGHRSGLHGTEAHRSHQQAEVDCLPPAEPKTPKEEDGIR